MVDNYVQRRSQADVNITRQHSDLIRISFFPSRIDAVSCLLIDDEQELILGRLNHSGMKMKIELTYDLCQRKRQ